MQKVLGKRVSLNPDLSRNAGQFQLDQFHVVSPSTLVSTRYIGNEEEYRQVRSCLRNNIIFPGTSQKDKISELWIKLDTNSYLYVTNIQLTVGFPATRYLISNNSTSFSWYSSFTLISLCCSLYISCVRYSNHYLQCSVIPSSPI